MDKRKKKGDKKFNLKNNKLGNSLNTLIFLYTDMTCSKIKILHLYSDEKFYNFIKLTFGIDELSNTYLNLSENNSIFDIEDYSIVILHYLDTRSINFIKQHKIVQPIVWFFWGSDGFSLGKFTYLFLENKTKKARIKLSFQKNFIFGIKQIIKLIYPSLSDYQKYAKYKINTIEKFSLIVPIMPGDYDILKNKYQITPPKFHLNYVNPLFSSKIFPKTNGTNILLGNSASYTNNHIEAIDWLKKKKLSDRKIIIPLNYGDKQLASYIKKYAIKELGAENVIIFEEFLPFEEYNKIVMSCNVLIMNHKRQQALGNVVQALLSGAHIYFNKNSTIYKYLKENNVICSEISGYNTIRALKANEQELNRKKANELFGIERQHNKVREMIQFLINQEDVSPQNSYIRC